MGLPGCLGGLFYLPRMLKLRLLSQTQAPQGWPEYRQVLGSPRIVVPEA